MSYTTKRFAIRTIKDGVIVIDSKVFRPREYYYERDQYDLEYLTPYNGELEGKRCAFGRYTTGDLYEGYVHLWGSSDYYFADMETREEMPGSPNLIDGYYRWDWWYTEDEWERRKEIIDRMVVTS